MLALNHSRESEFVRLGGLPYLKNLSIINLPFRQFILPIICEFVHCDNHVRRELKKHGMLTVYFNLLLIHTGNPTLWILFTIGIN